MRRARETTHFRKLKFRFTVALFLIATGDFQFYSVHSSTLPIQLSSFLGKMGYCVAVVRNNLAGAFKKLRAFENADNVKAAFLKSRYYLKPGEQRRLQQQKNAYRYQRRELYQNLRTVFARKARGF